MEWRYLFLATGGLLVLAIYASFAHAMATNCYVNDSLSTGANFTQASCSFSAEGGMNCDGLQYAIYNQRDCLNLSQNGGANCSVEFDANISSALLTSQFAFLNGQNGSISPSSQPNPTYTYWFVEQPGGGDDIVSFDYPGGNACSLLGTADGFYHRYRFEMLQNNSYLQSVDNIQKCYYQIPDRGANLAANHSFVQFGDNLQANYQMHVKNFSVCTNKSSAQAPPVDSSDYSINITSPTNGSTFTTTAVNFSGLITSNSSCTFIRNNTKNISFTTSQTVNVSTPHLNVSATYEGHFNCTSLINGQSNFSNHILYNIVITNIPNPDYSINITSPTNGTTFTDNNIPFSGSITANSSCNFIRNGTFNISLNLSGAFSFMLPHTNKSATYLSFLNCTSFLSPQFNNSNQVLYNLEITNSTGAEPSIGDETLQIGHCATNTSEAIILFGMIVLISFFVFLGFDKSQTVILFAAGFGTIVLSFYVKPCMAGIGWVVATIGIILCCIAFTMKPK